MKQDSTKLIASLKDLYERLQYENAIYRSTYPSHRKNISIPEKRREILLWFTETLFRILGSVFAFVLGTWLGRNGL